MPGKALSTRIAEWGHRVLIDAHAAWIAARSRDTPVAARVLAFLVAAYALSPIDLIPDFIPVLGLIDDVLIVPAGLWVVRRMIPDALFARYRAAAAAADSRPRSRLGLAIILSLWAAALWLVYWGVRTSSYH